MRRGVVRHGRAVRTVRAVRAVRLVGLAAALGLLAGCGLGSGFTGDLGQGVGLGEVSAADDEWTLTATFDDALNLPLGAPVKVEGATVGRVLQVAPEDYRARVVMALDDDAPLRAGTTARLRYTTALGELYVDVTPAADGAVLDDGARLPAAATTVAPTVEDALSAASLLVNGGSLQQVGTIVDELNDALDGRTGTARGVLRETSTFLAQALRSTRALDRALAALDDTSRTLRARQRTINAALRDIRPAARVLARNTDRLADLLDSADDMARSTDRLVRRTRTDLRVIVKELGPVLDAVLDEQERLVPGLDTINTWGATLDDRTPTTYLNLYFKLDVAALLDPSTLPGDRRTVGLQPTLGLPGLLVPVGARPGVAP